MATEFKRNRAGSYTAKFLNDYTATITKLTDRWQLTFAAKGKRGKTTYWWTLRDAKAEADRLAKSTTVEVVSLMSQKPVKIAIDTPLCCNPSSETYWSM